MPRVERTLKCNPFGAFCCCVVVVDDLSDRWGLDDLGDVRGESCLLLADHAVSLSSVVPDLAKVTEVYTVF